MAAAALSSRPTSSIGEAIAVTIVKAKRMLAFNIFRAQRTRFVTVEYQFGEGWIWTAKWMSGE